MTTTNDARGRVAGMAGLAASILWVGCAALGAACDKATAPPQAPAPIVRASPAPPAGSAATGAPAAKPPAGAPGTAPAGSGVSTAGNASGSTQAGGFKVSGADGDPMHIEVGGLTMVKPVTWVWTQPSMAFRALQYSVPAIGTSAPAAELVFSVFAGGEGGPVGANLDRWAGQFRGEDGGAAAQSQRTEATVNGMAVSRIESKGAYMGMGQAAPRPKQMQLGAIVQAPGRNIFIKLVGPEATVESNRAAFDAMLASMK